MTYDPDFKFDIGQWVKVACPYDDTTRCFGMVVTRMDPQSAGDYKSTPPCSMYLVRVHGRQKQKDGPWRHLVSLDVPTVFYEIELEAATKEDLKARPREVGDL